MSSSKQVDLSRDFAAGVYLSEAQNLIPPPLITLLFTQGRGVRGGMLNQRELEKRFQSWVKSTNVTEYTQEISRV
jgi:hypothetical protein